VPVVAVVLLLGAPRALAAGAAFLVGWSLTIALLVAGVAALVEPADEGTADDRALWVVIAKVALGVGVLWFALREWRGRPRPGQAARLPSWMAAIDQMTPLRASALGATLAAANPKHIPLLLAGGLSVGTSTLGLAGSTLAIVGFVAVASIPVGIPVLGFLVAPDRAKNPLDSLRGWLTANNAVLMALMFLLVGATIIGSGLADL